MSMDLIFVSAETLRHTGSTERKDQRIVGGDPAPAGRFPFYGQYDGSFLCGSTLIHDDIVIGAAHCCAPSECGLLFDSIERGSGTPATVEQYVVHPQYNARTFSNDIMAMKLTSSLAGISPSGYNTDSAIPTNNQELTTIGFGTTSQGGSLSDDLLQVTVNYVPHGECSQFYGNEVLENEMLCAAAPGKDSCQGDSGGPIFRAADGSGDTVGIVSWGYGCAQTEPGVYTRLSNYDAWIEEAICCLSDNAPSGCTCSASVGSVQSCSQTGSNTCPTSGTISTIIDSVSNFVCLSPDATTLVETKGKVAIKDVAVGDKVMTASGQYETVFTISNSNPDKATTFLRVESDMDENPLELTPLHMLFLQGKHTPIPAKDVRIGDFVKTLNGPREVTNITVVTRNGFYNPITTDGTIVVDGVFTSTYASLNGGSYLEIGGMKLISFHSLLDMTISPFRAFCLGVSLDYCNEFRKQNDKPGVVYIMTQFYKFWMQQHVVVQFAAFFAHICFFGFARLLFSPAGILVLVTFIGMICSSTISVREKNAMTTQKKVK